MLSLPQLTERVQTRLGRTLRGKYRLDSVLGVGGMGAVYAATHRNTKRFAVKMLHPELSVNDDIRTRFLREGYAANSVGHPGTVAVLDDDVAEDGSAFLVMELLDGAGVDSIWERYHGKVPASIAVGIVDQLLEVLSAAHAKGIVHRDIKPANLFLTTDGTVKVLDFGIARAREAAAGGESGAGTATGTMLGSPAFMSPEQAMAKSSEVDAQTDVWAAAATLFTVVSGEFVHQGENATQQLILAATQRARSLASVAPHVPAALVEIVDRGLVFEKGGRWRNAGAMRGALREAYATAFGGSPDRASLATLLEQLRAPTPVRTPAPAPMTATFEPPKGTVGAPHVPETISTTARPVEAGVAERAVRRAGPSSRLRLLAGVGVTAVALAAAFLALRPKASPPPAEAATSAPIVAASPAPPPSPIVLEPQKLVEPASEPVTGSSAVAPARSSAAVRPPSAPPKAASQAPKCDPPYYFDARGNRLFKKECL